MTPQTSRQASSLLSLSLRPRTLRSIPSRPILASSQRCIHEEQQQQQPEKVQYERKPSRLPYTHTKTFENARAQPRAPFEVRVRKPFAVNDDKKVLDAMYTKLFGNDVELPSDIKWQAVTHKSFDHGRQPFNTKLRFLGKRLLQMHAAFNILSSPPKDETRAPRPSTYKSLEGLKYQNPEPYVHKDYRNIDNVNRTNIDAAMSEDVLLPLIKESGLTDVMRWKPAENNDLLRSGQVLIATECLHAIIGALALQKGGDAAAQFIRERILKVSS